MKQRFRYCHGVSGDSKEVCMVYTGVQRGFRVVQDFKGFMEVIQGFKKRVAVVFCSASGGSRGFK